MDNSGMWKVRLIAFGAAIAFLGLAFALATGMPFILLLAGLMVVIGAPLIIFSLGWLGVWLMTLAGLWGGSLLLFFFSAPRIGSMSDFVLMCLVLAGLTGLGIAVLPPHVAAKHRAAWPFGYLNPHRDAEKAKRERLLLEEEIVYDRIPDRWDDADEEEDDLERILALPKRKSSAR